MHKNAVFKTFLLKKPKTNLSLFANCFHSPKIIGTNDFEIMATENFFCKIIFNNAMKIFSLKASK